MKKSNYIFTRIFVPVLIVTGLLLAIFPGLYVLSDSIEIGGQKVIFEITIPTYIAIFGGKISSSVGLSSESLAIEGLKDLPEVQSILNANYNFEFGANIFVAIFLVLSLAITPLFLIKIKSRIVSLITVIIYVITTISLATSNLIFDINATSSVLKFNPENARLYLGYMFMIISYALATTFIMVHLFRLLIKTNSSEQELDSNLKD